MKIATFQLICKNLGFNWGNVLNTWVYGLTQTGLFDFNQLVKINDYNHDYNQCKKIQKSLILIFFENPEEKYVHLSYTLP